MKSFLPAFIFAAMFISSCKKDGSGLQSNPVVLLTKITNNIPGDAFYGRPVAEFTYSGKTLAKAVMYYYDYSQKYGGYQHDTVIRKFVYNNKNVLTSVNFLSSPAFYYTYYGYGTETVKTDNAGNITAFYVSKTAETDIFSRHDTLSYNNGLLMEWAEDQVGRAEHAGERFTFQANNNGNNISRTGVWNGDLTGFPGDVFTVTSFDTAKSVTRALPYYTYFMTEQYKWLYFLPGLNNPIAANDNGNAFTYSYEYNAQGYPTKISWTDQTFNSYIYEYTTVN